MASFVKWDFRPEFRSPILIEGLPGVGNVGKIAADYAADALGAKRVLSIFSEELPPHVSVNEDSVAVPVSHSLWMVPDVRGHDILFLLGQSQGTDMRGQYLLSDFVLRMILKYDPFLVITLGGYGKGAEVPDPGVIGAVSRAELKERFAASGVKFIPGEPGGGIIGAAAVFLALAGVYGIDSVCLMGETSGYAADFRSAGRVVSVISDIIGREIDVSGFDELISDSESSESPEKDTARESRLSYFG